MRVSLRKRRKSFSAALWQLRQLGGKGWGSRLVEEILNLCAEKWPEKIIEIEAQKQVVGLYEKFGFVTQGDPFIFESTPHIKMIYEK